MTNIQYRREIDGLRAIAVVSVLLFHVDHNIFRGGYIGVDIFFVISGFLISSIISNDLKNNNFSIINFYERRIRRIIPALILVLIISFLVSLIILDPIALKFHSLAQITSLFFTSNILFSSSVNYFENSFNPLLHTWSLGVEEQFYLIYPILFLIFFKKYKGLFFLTIFLIFLLSLFLGQLGGNFSLTYPYIENELFFFSSSKYFDFFLVQSRIWEILLGCGTFFLYTNFYYLKNYIPDFLNNLILILGLLLVITPVFLYDNSIQIPSIYLLIPTVGTSIIILFYKTNSTISFILVNKFSVFIGLISYSLYLWHYPIFTYFDIVKIDDRNLMETLILIIVSIIISWISWKYIETFFRNKKLISKVTIFRLFVFSILFLSLANAIIYKFDGIPQRFSYAKIFDGTNDLLDPIVNDCWAEKVNINAGTCVLGNINKTPKFAIIGDSLVISHLHLINKIGIEKDISIKVIVRGSCPPLKNVNFLPLNNSQRCKELNDKLIDLLDKDKIKNVILVSKWSKYFKGDYENRNVKFLNKDNKLDKKLNLKTNAKYFELGLKNRIQSFDDKDINYYIISQVPIQKYDPRKIYNYNNNKLINLFIKKGEVDSFLVSRDEHEMHHDEINKLFKKIVGQRYIDVSGHLCNTKCLIGNLKIPYYVDRTHLSNEGSNALLRRTFENLLN